MKKIWLLLASLFGTLFVGTTFANPIAPERYYYCTMFENTDIDNYRIVVQNDSNFYEPNAYSCSQCWEREKEITNWKAWWKIRYDYSFQGPNQKVYLLNKSINIEDITTDNINDNAIEIWSITSTYCDILYNKTMVYKIINSWNNYTMLDRTEHYKIRQEIKNKVKDFPLYRSLAVIIETLILFFIAKIFRKRNEIEEKIWYEKNEISNKKLLLWWILPTTLTLPLLWFVLPLLLWNWILYIIIWEILVMILETIIIKYWLNISWNKAIITSIICNIWSFLILRNNINSPFYIKVSLRGLFMVVIIEGIILFLIGKLSKEWITNKKLALCWFLTPIIEFIILILIIRIFEKIFLTYSDVSLTIIIILIKLIVDTLIIKWIRKISRKKTIITSIFYNLCFGAIILTLIYFFNQ